MIPGRATAARAGGRRGAAALAILAVALAGAGCGGEDRPAEVEPAVDRSDRISKLERKVDRLRARAARAEAEAEAAELAGADGASAGSLDRLVAGLPGRAGVAVGAPGGGGAAATGGGLATGAAWSTIKLPIAARALADGGGPDGIGGAGRDRITAAITRSDNEAAAALFAGLEAAHGGPTGASAAVGETLRRAGDRTTVISTEGRDGFSTYGQTEWSLAEQVRYVAALAGGCVGDAASRRFLLDRMGAVGGSDVFGLGALDRPARWKGGWGPGIDGRYLVRQVGLLEAGGGPVVVAMAAIPDDGSFESGQEMLNEIAARTARRYAGEAPPPSPC